MALSLCGSTVENTGGIACDKSRGVAKKFFIFNGAFAEADYADAGTFFDALVANSKLSKLDANKVFVLDEVQEIEKTSEANTEGALGLGFKTILREGRPAYRFKFFGGSDQLKRLRKFNNQTVRVVEYDANGVAWVYQTGTEAKGFQAKLFFTGNDMATGQNVEEGVIEGYISILSISEYKDNCKWVDLSDYNIEDVKALIDVQLAKLSNASNVHKITMIAAGTNLIEGYNIGADFGAAVALLDANFSALSGAGVPATALVITSVTYDSALEALTVTYDSTAYSSATGNIKLVPPTPTQLDAGDVTGVELLSVTYAKP